MPADSRIDEEAAAPGTNESVPGVTAAGATAPGAAAPGAAAPGAVSAESVRAEIEQTVREHYGRMLALLIHQFGDIELAEDVLQEAALIALEKWITNGIPEKPIPWLVLTAKNKAIDKLRRQQHYLTVEKQMAILDKLEHDSVDEKDEDAERYPDRRLSLIFTCCHPALDQQVRVALTLKTLCGLSTFQIASAFLVSETTMAQRIVRAKRKIKSAGIPYQVPPAHLIQSRLESVLAVIYFIFNEGYHCSSGNKLVNEEFCEEAIHLAAMMLKLLPEESEVMGLYALILFHHARSTARVDSKGQLIDLENQNRIIWDRSLIERADRLLKEALAKGNAGPYQLQAAISAIHAHAETFEETDWKQIVMLYQKLEAIRPNAVVRLNLTIALSYAEDANIALMYLDQIEDLDQLDCYHPYYLTRAELLRRQGCLREAESMYQKAVDLCDNSVEKQHIMKKMRATTYNQ